MTSWQICRNLSSRMNVEETAEYFTDPLSTENVDHVGTTSDFDDDKNNEKKDSDIDDDEDCENVLVVKVKVRKPPISKQMIIKLRHIFVQLKHEVPKQHKIGKTCCSLPLTKTEKSEFIKHVEIIKSGKFDENEDGILRDNWKKFCAIHNLTIDNDHFFEKKYDNIKFIKVDKERKKFVQFLANGLPNRSLFSVFKRFERIYGRTRQDEVKYV